MMVVTAKITGFWDVLPCGLPSGLDGGSRFFQSVGACLSQCMTGHLDRLHDELITP